METKTTLKVRFQVVGFHQWVEAPLKRRYLAEKHRHTFHFMAEVEAEVNNSRAEEFHDLLSLFRDRLHFNYRCAEDIFDFDEDSCEMIAANMLRTPFNAVEVWEDNECGARVALGDLSVSKVSEAAKPTTCECGHPIEAHGPAGCYVRVEGIYCSCVVECANEVDLDLAHSLSTYREEEPNEPTTSAPKDDIPF